MQFCTFENKSFIKKWFMLLYAHAQRKNKCSQLYELKCGTQLLMNNL